MVPDQADREAADKAQRHKSEEEEPVTTLKARSELVQLFFNVKDKKGGLIPSLTKDEFEIYDNKQPQTIKYFTANSNLPLTLGIMIDTISASRTCWAWNSRWGGRSWGKSSQTRIKPSSLTSESASAWSRISQAACDDSKTH
jgi:hypothetical protein